MITEHTGWTGYHVSPSGRPSATTAPVSRIVVALDGSAFAERGLEAADALAAAAAVPLHLVSVRRDQVDAASTLGYLHRAARRAPRVSEVSVEIGTDVAGYLAGLAETGSLVVLATHARGALGDVLFGSVADAVLRATTRPVLLVGPAAGVPDPQFATVVVPDDAGLGAWRLREHASAWARHLDAVAWAVQVLPLEPGGRVTDVLEEANVLRVAEELGPRAEGEVLHGPDPAERIVEFARDHSAGLIATTATPRHRLGPDIAGGVALQVIRHAPCPVLVMGREER
jgi:nucleotide-binding universal stress UspA family protein